MTAAVYDSPLISGKAAYSVTGLGIDGATIRSTTATGDSGPGVLYNDWDSGDDAKLFSLLLVTPPSAGTLVLNDDGSFSFSGAPDGSYSFVYRLFVDGADMGTATVSLSVGVATSPVTSDQAGSYNVRSSAQLDGAAGYNVRGSAQQDASSAYALRAPALADFAGAYSIRVGAQQDSAAAYAVRAGVSSDFADSYSITNSGTAFADQAGSYNVRAAVSADATGSFSTRGSVFADEAGTFDVLAPTGSGGGGLDWGSILGNGKTAGQTLVEVHAMLSELHRIHGLAAGVPLVVDRTTRTAGVIQQSISELGDTVTITRQ